MTYQKTIFTLLASVALLFTACGTESSKTEVIHVKASDVTKKELDVKGMTCVGCEARLEKALLKVDGVLKFKASAKNNTASVEFDKSKTDVEKINKVLKEMGYDSSAKK
jgi:copper chaperone CopZ